MGEGRVKPTSRKPSFFWQGVLILAPVLVLATIGAYALSKEHRLALREAEGRAQDLTDDAARRIWEEVQSLQARSVSANATRIEFDRHGKLLFPKPYDRVPIPHPLDDRNLDPEQRRLWNELRQRQAIIGSGSATEFRDLARDYETLLQSNLPDAFAASAHFN